MNTMKKAFKLPQAIIDKYNRLLDMTEVDFDKENVDTDATLYTATVAFEDGIEADIKVCSGQTNLFVDPVLFHNGSEVVVNDAEDSLDGEYQFDYNGKQYIASIEAA